MWYSMSAYYNAVVSAVETKYCHKEAQTLSRLNHSSMSVAPSPQRQVSFLAAEHSLTCCTWSAGQDAVCGLPQGDDPAGFPWFCSHLQECSSHLPACCRPQTWQDGSANWDALRNDSWHYRLVTARTQLLSNIFSNTEYSTNYYCISALGPKEMTPCASASSHMKHVHCIEMAMS